MKQGIVKFSKEFITPTGLKEWVGIEYPFDLANNEDPKWWLTQARNTVEQWHKETNHILSPVSSEATKYGPPTELPVINKAEERLGILIENSATKEELMKYKDDITTPYLADLFSTKQQQLLMKAKQ